MGKGGKGSVQDTRQRKGAATKKAAVRYITVDEIKKHRTPKDAWMVYRNKVYDVSNWHEHPGGDVIFTHAGDDFTDIFNAFHKKTSFNLMKRFYIGELDLDNSTEGFQGPTKTEEQTKFEEAYRNLRTELIRDGLYEASHLYYFFKCMSQFAIWSTGVYFAYASSFGSYPSLLLSALVLALFFQQSGWLAHDYLHHQVFKNRFYGDCFGMLWGNLAQGFSQSWWKNKHNSHHAVPNLHSSLPDAQDGDPDIDTMPLLAWSMTMAKYAEESKLGRFMVTWQSVLYFPILCVARVSWLTQSFLHVFDGLQKVGNIKFDKKSHFVQYPKAELAFLMLHYVWYFMCVYWAILGQGLLGAAAFIVANNCLCGLFLAVVFGLGHNGMKTYDADKRPDFWKLQVTTTRNITSNWFLDWFCGGLQYQVEHHLFPSIPRHHLPEIHQRVVKFCKENGVTYHETGVWVGTKEVLSHLNAVSKEFLEHFPAM